MKKITMILAALILAGFGISAQANDEFLEGCEAYVEASGSNVDCSCLDEAAHDDESLYDEYAKVTSPEEVTNMSEAAQEVAASCTG